MSLRVYLVADTKEAKALWADMCTKWAGGLARVDHAKHCVDFAGFEQVQLMRANDPQLADKVRGLDVKAVYASTSVPREILELFVPCVWDSDGAIWQLFAGEMRP